jgi:hypothetical protein
LHESIINNDATLEESKSSIGVAYGLTVYSGEPRDLEKKISEFKSCAIVPKQELSAADIANRINRNLLFLTLQSGEFSQGIKKTAKNVLIRITLRRNDDLSAVANCMTRGKGPMARCITTWDSSVHYHLNNPTWSERLCIQLPEDEGLLDRYHLYFDVSHVSSSVSKQAIEPFSYSFLPLAESARGTTIKDGVYKPSVFKYISKDGKLEKGERFTDSQYLQFDPSTREKRMTKEKLCVLTQLIPISMSADIDCHRILNFSHFSPEELNNSLLNILRKSPAELVHILPALFDSLFAILKNPKLNQAESNVYKSAQAAVIHLIVTSPKDKNLGIMLNHYVTNIYNQPAVHYMLVNYIQSLIQWVTSDSAAKISAEMVLGEPNYRVLLNVIQGIQHIILFILKSYASDLTQSEPNKPAQNFAAQMNSFIVAFNNLAQLDSPAWIIQLQKLWLENFSILYNALAFGIPSLPALTVFAQADLVNYTVTFFEILNKSNSELNINKLSTLRKYVKEGKLNEEQWQIKLTATIITQFHFHIQKDRDINERILSVQLMLDLIPTLLQCIDENNSRIDVSTKQTFIKIVDQVTLFLPQLFELCGEMLWAKSNLLFDQYESKVIPQLKSVDFIRDCVVVIVSLLLTPLVDEQRFEYLFSTLTEKSKEIERGFLLCAYHAVTKLMHNSAFNKFWLLLRLKEIQLSVRLIEWTSTRLCENYLIAENFDAEIWKAFFQLSTSCLLADEMNVENCETEKRAYITGRFPDLRSTISAQLQLVWGFLGPKQAELIDVMVGPLVELTQNANEQVVNMAREMFFNLLQREFDLKANFHSVQYHTIDTVAKVIHDFGIGKIKGRQALDSYIKFFTQDLFENLQAHPVLLPAGTVFLCDIQG